MPLCQYLGQDCKVLIDILFRLLVTPLLSRVFRNNSHHLTRDVGDKEISISPLFHAILLVMIQPVRKGRWIVALAM